MSEQPKDFADFVAARAVRELPDDVATASSVVCLARPGTPVVYVSPAFEAHTGYGQPDVIGRNLALLQGPETEPEAVSRFRALIARCEAGSVRITNYRKDGSRFVHICELRPIKGADGTVAYFVAVQRPARAA